MAKTVEEVLTKMKGTEDISEIKAGKGAFSQAGFNDLVNAMANDTTYKFKTYNKEGEVTGEVSISDLIRDDLKKTIAKAKYPQKSEEAVLDTCEVVTNGLAKAIPEIVMQQIGTGRKFDLPIQEKVQGSIYLADVPGKVKETSIRNPSNQEPMGTVTTTTEDWIQIRSKSSTPAHLMTKVQRDVDGKITEKKK